MHGDFCIVVRCSSTQEGGVHDHVRLNSLCYRSDRGFGEWARCGFIRAGKSNTKKGSGVLFIGDLSVAPRL